MQGIIIPSKLKRLIIAGKRDLAEEIKRERRARPRSSYFVAFTNLILCLKSTDEDVLSEASILAYLVIAHDPPETWSSTAKQNALRLLLRTQLYPKTLGFVCAVLENVFSSESSRPTIVRPEIRVTANYNYQWKRGTMVLGSHDAPSLVQSAVAFTTDFFFVANPDILRDALEEVKIFKDRFSRLFDRMAEHDPHHFQSVFMLNMGMMRSRGIGRSITGGTFGWDKRSFYCHLARCTLVVMEGDMRLIGRERRPMPDVVQRAYFFVDLLEECMGDYFPWSSLAMLLTSLSRTLNKISLLGYGHTPPVIEACASILSSRVVESTYIVGCSNVSCVNLSGTADASLPTFGCCTERYCSRECQVQHWRAGHKACHVRQ